MLETLYARCWYRISFSCVKAAVAQHLLVVGLLHFLLLLWYFNKIFGY